MPQGFWGVFFPSELWISSVWTCKKFQPQFSVEFAFTIFTFMEMTICSQNRVKQGSNWNCLVLCYLVKIVMTKNKVLFIFLY